MVAGIRQEFTTKVEVCLSILVIIMIITITVIIVIKHVLSLAAQVSSEVFNIQNVQRESFHTKRRSTIRAMVLSWHCSMLMPLFWTTHDPSSNIQ